MCVKLLFQLSNNLNSKIEIELKVLHWNRAWNLALLNIQFTLIYFVVRARDAFEEINSEITEVKPLETEVKLPKRRKIGNSEEIKEKCILPKLIMVSKIQDVTEFTQQIASECDFIVSIVGRWLNVTTEMFNAKEKNVNYLTERKFQFYLVSD